MEDIGYTSNAKPVYLSVFGALNREVKKLDSPITKVLQKWALRKWYDERIGIEAARTARPAEEGAN